MFANKLQAAEMAAFRKRLFESLNGKLDWALGPPLLTWLVAGSPIKEGVLFDIAGYRMA